jgi:hypothetical protein
MLKHLRRINIFFQQLATSSTKQRPGNPKAGSKNAATTLTHRLQVMRKACATVAAANCCRYDHLCGRHDDVDRHVMLKHLRRVNLFFQQLAIVDGRHHWRVLIDCTHPAQDAILQLGKTL